MPSWITGLKPPLESVQRPSPTIPYPASTPKLYLLLVCKATVMMRSIFLGWWGRTHAISPSVCVPPLAELQQVDRSKRRRPLRCGWRGDWWSPLSCVSSQHTHSITLPHVLAMSWLKSLTWCILSQLELVLSQFLCAVCAVLNRGEKKALVKMKESKSVLSVNSKGALSSKRYDQCREIDLGSSLPSKL